MAEYFAVLFGDLESRPLKKFFSLGLEAPKHVALKTSSPLRRHTTPPLSYEVARTVGLSREGGPESEDQAVWPPDLNTDRPETPRKVETVRADLI